LSHLDTHFRRYLIISAALRAFKLALDFLIE
jgi:hypothetical protein